MVFVHWQLGHFDLFWKKILLKIPYRSLNIHVCAGEQSTYLDLYSADVLTAYPQSQTFCCTSLYLSEKRHIACEVVAILRRPFGSFFWHFFSSYLLAGGRSFRNWTSNHVCYIHITHQSMSFSNLMLYLNSLPENYLPALRILTYPPHHGCCWCVQISPWMFQHVAWYVLNYTWWYFQKGFLILQQLVHVHHSTDAHQRNDKWELLW